MRDRDAGHDAAPHDIVVLNNLLVQKSVPAQQAMVASGRWGRSTQKKGEPGAYPRITDPERVDPNHYAKYFF